MSSQLTDKELQHIEAMIKQVLLVTNSPQCGGDMQMAMDMMRLDDLEQAIVINSLREQFMKQKEPAADQGIQSYGEDQMDDDDGDDADFESVPEVESALKSEPEEPVQQKPPTWIEWFCSLENHKFVEPIDPQFLLNPDNHIDLYQKSNSLNFNPLPKQRFADCLKLILASHAPSAQDLENQNFEQLQQEAFEVYSLMHARYIRSPEGKQPLLCSTLQVWQLCTDATKHCIMATA